MLHTVRMTNAMTRDDICVVFCFFNNLVHMVHSMEQHGVSSGVSWGPVVGRFVGLAQRNPKPNALY